MQFFQSLKVSSQTDSPRESCASKGVGCGAMHAEHIGDTGAIMSNAQPQAVERAHHLEQENADLKQQLTAMESRYDSSRQRIEAQATELAEKNQVIQALQSKLSRLSNLAAAFADEVQSASCGDTGMALPMYRARQAEEQHTAAAAAPPAPQQKPAVPTATPEQPLNVPAALAVLTRLHQRQLQHQHNASVVAAAAAAAEAAAAAHAAAAAGMRLPSAGRKRGRLCSATGSGCDATKHAASGGSSSSHQQLSADEELDDDVEGDEVDDEEEATAGCISAKRQRSPNSCERLVQPSAAAAAAAAEHRDADEDDDKSQDDLDAAQCLQQLAMSAGSGEAQGTNYTGMPSLFDSLSNCDRFAASRGAASNLARWGSSGHAAAVLPGADAGAAAAYAGSSSSNGSGGNAGNSNAFHQVAQAHLLSYLGALNPEGFEGFHNPRTQQQGAQAAQQKRLSLPFGSAQQQAAQPQHQFGAACGGLAMQRSGSMGASRGAATKSAPAAAAPAGSMAAPARARKQSWFQTEIAEKIPLSVQQQCAREWAGQQCMAVVCADLCGTFYVNSAGEYLIKLAHSGEVVTPNKFEDLAGKKTARNWQQSIRLQGFTMNGDPNSALLKLGHFTRIVGLVQDR
ncbi:hypothetical protein COO60DRAFT_612441 [Scenedesmus sp. NREL 46B-D3]|nr:hypothetical protein COO60DRAFT_612441 [Scenedesmus sp. NREL 46B-D3]